MTTIPGRVVGNSAPKSDCGRPARQTGAITHPLAVSPLRQPQANHLIQNLFQATARQKSNFGPRRFMKAGTTISNNQTGEALTMLMIECVFRPGGQALLFIIIFDSLKLSLSYRAIWISIWGKNEDILS
jgi:hypothetical protein